jgi:hypothetical protein
VGKGLLSFVAAAPLVAGSFAWTDHKDGRLELKENGRSVLVYNYGQMLKPGVPEDRRRCCYLFPVLTPAGVSVLDDFPKDHYHHRGLFWGWPSVTIGGTEYDNWALKGMQTRELKHAARGARLTAENGWFVGERRVVRELLEVRLEPARAATRALHVTLTLEALEAPVTLAGAHDKDKSYGGFSARFAPRTATVIHTDKDTIGKRDDLHPHAWAEMDAVYEGKRAVLRITPDAANPGFPHQWCLREYGFVGASFPGKTEERPNFTLQPGRPVKLGFTVTLTDR